ncbi:MAG TPA: flagellar basal-body MS-ring/collar protein FliF [Bacillota bacterium]|nr:flagellar basal-body MS-ring/collar protein FliF [Bacillota bacterium]
MKEKLLDTRDTAVNHWKSLNKKRQITYIFSLIFIIGLIALILTFSLKKNFVPLYNNLSVQEVSQIKEELEARGVAYEIKDGGTTITVPENQADSLIVELAGEGIPRSGHIDYSFFSENVSWGMTDNEFNMIKLDAMRTELANLIKGIEGIEDASVMINLPEESVFINDSKEEASASIIIHTSPGYQFEGNQIESLYHLVSKAIPNLPKENIFIRNQYLEYFDVAQSSGSTSHDEFSNQQSIKRDIERDIQRRLQQMLGSIVGIDNVIVSVTTDIDFTQENRIEDLVDPVDVENMEGLPVSVETIQETYTGGLGAGGVVGTGEEDIPGYVGVEGADDGEYELIKETVNNEFNHIRKEIVESPYKVRDIGVQVAIDNVVSTDGGDVQYLTEQEMATVEEGVASILHSMITTSIDKGYGEIDPAEKVSIVFHEFTGKEGREGVSSQPLTKPSIWLYVIGGLLLFVIIGLIVFAIIRRRKSEDSIMDEAIETPQPTEIPDLMESEITEEEVRRKQLEKMARENPEEFTKLLRSWIADD